MLEAHSARLADACRVGGGDRFARSARQDRRALGRLSRVAGHAPGAAADRPRHAARGAHASVAGRADRRARGARAARGRCGSRHRGHARRTVVRVRARRLAAGCARRRLDDVDVGPERRPVRTGACGRDRRGGCRRVAARAVRASPGRVVRVRDRLPDGARHGTRSRARARAARARLGARRPRSLRRAAGARRRRRQASRHGRQGASTARHGRTRDRPRGRPGTNGRRRPPARRAPDDRLRAGRRGEHRRVRRRRRDRGPRARGRRLAARRRRLRAVGGGLPLAPAPRPRRRARGLLGDRRAQVAERAVRLGPRVLRAPGRPSSRDGRPCRVPRARRRREPRPARLEPGVLAPRARLSGLRGPSLARAFGRLRADHALVRARTARSRGARTATRAPRC